MSQFRRACAVVAAITCVQAVLETVALAVLHRDLLLAPYRFFTVQAWDAPTKLYQTVLVPMGLPDLLSAFLSQGIASKLGLLPALIAPALLWALVFAAVITLGSRLFGLSAQLAAPAYARRIAVVVLILQVAVHLLIWIPSVKIPMDATLVKVASNFARNAVFDGVALSISLAVVATLLGPLVALRGAAPAMISALLLAAVPAGWHAMSTEVVTPAHAAAARLPSTTASASAPAPNFNVVLISIDSLRADHLGSYGYHRETSPTMDALADSGVIFRHCQSTTSWTLPAHLSLLTGRSLLGHGVVTDDRQLTDDVGTLAEAFSGAGYETKAIVSAPYLNSRYGFARGFDDYDDRTVYFETNEESYRSVTAPRLQAEATQWLGKPRDKPFFLFLHYWDVHYDYAPGAPYDRMFDPDYSGPVDGENFYFNNKIRNGMDPRDLEHLLALYDGEIRLVDDHLAKLTSDLKAMGLADNTVIVVTADHGDEFFEHGEKGHHRTLYEEVLAVPFILNVPGWDPSARDVNAEVSIIDIAPTLLSLTGVAQPRGIEGRDLVPLLRGETDETGPVFGELYRKGSLNVQVSALHDRDKVIHHFNRRILESYGLEADPGEQIRRSETDSATSNVVALMASWLNRRWRSFDNRVREGGVEPVEIDDRTADMLRSLGYTD